MKSWTISFRDAYSFLNASSMISSALSICLTRLCYCSRVHPWQFGAQTHQSPPTPTPHCLVALKPFTFIQLTFHSSHSVGGGELSPFLSIDLRATIIVLWNETATAQFRQEAAHSVFLLFTICGILLLLFMLQIILITNVFAKTLNLQLWMMCMVFHCVWLVKSVFDLLK